MNEFLGNKTVQAVIAVLASVLILGLFGWLKFRRDQKLVSRLLEQSGLDSARRDRKTRGIAKATSGSKRRPRK